MKLELISFRLCPFVQSSVIVLLRKGIAHRLRYIDLNDPPDWFRALSPHGKVPLLRVGESEILFEAAAINAFLDEVTPGNLMPADPILRARNRAWIAFADKPLLTSRDLTTVATEQAFEETCTRLKEHLALLEDACAAGPFFNGSDFSLVDATYAPLFMRLALLDEMAPLGYLVARPRLAAWAAALAREAAVADSAGPDFPARLEDLVRRRRGYLASRLPGGTPPDGQKASRY